MRKIACTIAGLLMASPCFAQQPAVAETPMMDPWVPPSVRKSAGSEMPAARGAALRDEVEKRLRAPFDAAARDGSLTRDQAAAAGLGFIAQHFDAIDRARAGTIRFEDYKRFLKERGASLN